MTFKDSAEKLEHSLAARVIQVFLTPGLISITATLGWMTLADIRDRQGEQALKTDQQTAKVSDVSIKVDLLNARMEYQVLDQLKDLQRRLQELEKQTNRGSDNE